MPCSPSSLHPLGDAAFLQGGLTRVLPLRLPPLPAQGPKGEACFKGEVRPFQFLPSGEGEPADSLPPPFSASLSPQCIYCLSRSLVHQLVPHPGEALGPLVSAIHQYPSFQAPSAMWS